MKTILWAALSANGNYARSSPAHPPMREALADFGRETGAHGNFIVGRDTFEGFRAQQGQGGGPPPVDIFVISKTLVLPPGGPTVVPSPRAALEMVAARGHKTAVVVGGASVHNAFLVEGLVDEAVFVITPTLEDDGHKLVLARGERREARLLEHVELGNGVLRLRYAFGPAGTW